MKKEFVLMSKENFDDVKSKLEESYGPNDFMKTSVPVAQEIVNDTKCEEVLATIIEQLAAGKQDLALAALKTFTEYAYAEFISKDDFEDWNNYGFEYPGFIY